MHNALLHGKTLLVVATGDLEDAAFEFVAEGVGGDFGAHALVHEGAQFALIFNFDELLRAVGWVGDVELHGDGGGCCPSKLGCGLRLGSIDFRLRGFVCELAAGALTIYILASYKSIRLTAKMQGKAPRHDTSLSNRYSDYIC